MTRMRALHARILAVLLASAANAVSAQAVGDQSETSAAGPQASREHEIVVTGRRDSGKYRLAPQFRTRTDAGDRWRRSFARDRSCRNVGPRGCGLQPNPLITLRSDGSVQFGDPGPKD